MGVSIAMGDPLYSWKVYFRENPTKMDDRGVPPFQETPITILLNRWQKDIISSLACLPNPVAPLATCFGRGGVNESQSQYVDGP